MNATDKSKNKNKNNNKNGRLVNAIRRGNVVQTRELLRKGASPATGVNGSGWWSVFHELPAGTSRKKMMVMLQKYGRFRPPVNASKAYEWTNRSIRETRERFLKGNLIDKRNQHDLMIDQALGHAMRNQTRGPLFVTLRAPDVGMRPGNSNRPRYLYRGLSLGELGDVRTRGYVESDSYIATSTDESIANSFAENPSAIAQIDIRDIPEGTPWIWFGPGISGGDEREVLLPPGMLVLVKKSTYHGNMRMIYVPNVRAVTAIDSRRIVKRTPMTPPTKERQTLRALLNTRPTPWTSVFEFLRTSKIANFTRLYLPFDTDEDAPHVRKLLDMGFDPNTTDPADLHEPPLVRAVTCPTIFGMLLDAGANPDAKSCPYDTSLLFNELDRYYWNRREAPQARRNILRLLDAGASFSSCKPTGFSTGFSDRFFEFAVHFIRTGDAATGNRLDAMLKRDVGKAWTQYRSSFPFSARELGGPEEHTMNPTVA